MVLMLNFHGKEVIYLIGCVVYVYMRCVLIKEWQELRSVITKLQSKWSSFLFTFSNSRKPLPLTTVELQKQGARFLGMSSANIMKVLSTLDII